MIITITLSFRGLCVCALIFFQNITLLIFMSVILLMKKHAWHIKDFEKNFRKGNFSVCVQLILSFSKLFHNGNLSP